MKKAAYGFVGLIVLLVGAALVVPGLINWNSYKAEIAAEVRKGVTPSKKADRPIGQWNRFLIEMKGDRLTVQLNGETVQPIRQAPTPVSLTHYHSPTSQKKHPRQEAPLQPRFRSTPPAIWVR